MLAARNRKEKAPRARITKCRLLNLEVLKVVALAALAPPQGQ